MLELQVKLKSGDGERSYSLKEVVYEPLCLNQADNSDIVPYIEKALKAFGEPSEDVAVTIKMML